MKRIDGRFLVALSGRRDPGCENLSLAYLHGALEQAGFPCVTLPLNTLGDVRRAANQILASDARLTGLSLPDTHSAILALALGQMLADRGYRGHITCGGPFATTTRHWLLERYPWLSSVVRFAGEVPLTALARALASGAPLSQVPGLTTRDGDGRCAPVDASKFSTRPHRGVLTNRLGYNVASMVASRGCPGQCAYCGPAALQRAEKDEARKLGLGDAEIIRRGIGTVQRRDIDDLCDEMDRLRREENVRHFAFTDEHLLPFDENDALAYLRQLDRGLAQRGLTDIAMGGQLHAGRVSPRIARKLAKMGFVRILLGLDIAEGDGGAELGRVPFGAREAGIINILNRSGVATLSNIMLLHPYSTVDTVAAAMDAMASISHGMVEAGRVIVYEGTRLKERLDHDGRLFGNPLRWEYTAVDPAVQRFTKMFSALKTQAFGSVSIGVRIHETMWDVALARRLHPAHDLSHQTERLFALNRSILHTYVEAYRRALALAVREASEADERALVREFGERTGFLTKALEDINASIAERLPLLEKSPTSYRVFAATLFSFCLASSATTGCHHASTPEAGTEALDSDTPSHVESDPDRRPTDDTHPTDDTGEDSESAPESDLDTDTGSAMDSDFPDDTGADAVTDSQSVADTDTNVENDSDSLADTDAVTCDTDMTVAEASLVEETVSQTEPCFSGTIFIDTDGESTTRPTGSGPSNGIRITGPGVDALSERVEEVVEELDLHCENTVHMVSGGLYTESEDLMARAGAECDFHVSENFVVIDDEGYVTDILSYDGESSEDSDLAQCILKVLDGLAFPCLADTSLSYVYLLIV